MSLITKKGMTTTIMMALGIIGCVLLINMYSRVRVAKPKPRKLKRGNGVAARVTKLETEMRTLNTRMDTLETRMDTLETRMSTLESKVDTLIIEIKGVSKMVKRMAGVRAVWIHTIFDY